MDPLSALRDFTIRGELSKIVRVGDEFRFGDVFRFPCAVETAFRSKQGSLYPLEVLVYFLHHHQLKHTDYILSARRHGVAAVTLPDRKPLLDYLLGKVSSSESIQFAPPDEYRPDDPHFHASGLANNGAGATLGFDLETVPPADGRDGEDFRVRDSAGTDLDVMSMILEGERPLRDRNALLVCRNRNFFSVYAAAMEREEKRKRMDSQQRKDGLVAKSRLMGAGEERGMGREEAGFDSGSKAKMMKTGKIGDGVPIILVPSASSTLITIYNVKEFLEDGLFIPTDVKMKQMKGPKPECVTVQKKFGRDQERAVQAYEVRDKPTGLKSEDWDRVVAVFVLGKEWQFKEWPYKDHVEIFNKIVGFFMRFEDDSVESAKTVKQWNVKIISISKTKRHQDRAAALDVWDRLEEFMRARSHS